MAPVPDGRHYTDSERNALEFDPAMAELRFQNEYKQSEWIPDNYLDCFEDMLGSFVQWTAEVNCRKSRGRREWQQFTCPIVHMEFYADAKKKLIMRSCVLMRPCAENLGFYKLIMWVMRYSIIRFDFQTLRLENVLETNLQILQGMGFRAVLDPIYEFTNCELNHDELRRITQSDWRLNGVLDVSKTVEDSKFFYHSMFPSGNQLNDQKFVNDKFERSKRKRSALLKAGV